MIITKFFISIFLLLTINFIPSYAEILYSWSQVIPNNKLSVRAIVNDDKCPIAYIEGREVQMLDRYSSKDFEKVCELLLERNTKSIQIDHKQIPTLPRKINKIAFIGDTGCRVNILFQQECNSIDSWPLKRNLDSIMLHEPDLIIHVGDYHYRQAKCRNIQKCGNVYGYNTQAWYTDWFEPAKEISLRCPFLFVRGNHENCDRAYEGWFKYLDPYQYLSKKCENFVPGWFFDTESLKFFIFDSSFGQDIFTTKDEINAFNEQFNELLENNLNKPTWFVTHRPLWRSPKKEVLTLNNHAQVEALANNFPDNIASIVSGHIHIAQILLMKDLPDQITIGNGGALLHAQNQKSLYKNVEFNYSHNKNYLANEIRNLFGFGFAVLNIDDLELIFYNQYNDVTYVAKLTKDFRIKR